MDIAEVEYINVWGNWQESREENNFQTYSIFEQEVIAERQETKPNSKSFNRVSIGDQLENKGQILNIFGEDFS